jgi:hypothetical protein
VLRLILAFVDVMLHRRGPEDLPSSPFLLWSLFFVSLGVELGVVIPNNGVRAGAVSVLVSLLDLWFVWALLRTFSRERRFRQTMTALLGAGTILNLVGAPFVPFLRASVVASASADPQLTLPFLLTAVLEIWSIDIAAFVFARALERPYLLCVAVVLGYVLLIVSLQSTLMAPVT